LFAALKLQLATSGSVSLKNLDGIEPKLINRVASAAYAVESVPMETVDPLRELSALSYRLRVNYLSRKQEQLAHAIALLEANKGDVGGLRQEFDDLIKSKNQLLAELQSYGEKESRVG